MEKGKEHTNIPKSMEKNQSQQQSDNDNKNQDDLGNLNIQSTKRERAVSSTGSVVFIEPSFVNKEDEDEKFSPISLSIFYNSYKSLLNDEVYNGKYQIAF